MDNALEACEAVEEEARKIRLEVYSNNNNLIIKMLNAKSRSIVVDPTKTEGGFTSKEDAEGHGFGLLNIRQAVKKYGGIVKFEDNGDSFASNIAIPMKF